MTDMPETVWIKLLMSVDFLGRNGTWSEWKVHDTTEYVRGDIHQALQAENKALETELEWMRGAIANPPLQGFDDWFSAQYPSIPKQCREYAIANRAFNAGHKAGRTAIDES